MAEVWYEHSEATWSLWINAAHKLTHCFIAKAPWSSASSDVFEKLHFVMLLAFF